MQTDKKYGLSRVMELTVWVLMAGVVVLMVLLPWLVTTFTNQNPGDKLYSDYLITLYTTGVVGELVLWQCRGILHNVNIGCPFGKDMMRRLRVTGILCLMLALLYAFFILCLGVFKFFMALLLVVFAFIGLVLFVFAELFRQAAAYKEENDMTI